MEIKSYIKIPDVFLAHDFMEHPEDFFVDIDDLERLRGIAKKVDLDYIDGAIVIDYHGTLIMDYHLWDLVGVTWAYLMNTIEELLESGKSHMYLPDQPIRIDMEEIGGRYIKLVLGKGEYGKHAFPREELLHALLNGAEHFFLIVREELNTNKFDFHLEQITKMRGKL